MAYISADLPNSNTPCCSMRRSPWCPLSPRNLSKRDDQIVDANGHLPARFHPESCYLCIVEAEQEAGPGSSPGLRGQPHDVHSAARIDGSKPLSYSALCWQSRAARRCARSLTPSIPPNEPNPTEMRRLASHFTRTPDEAKRGATHLSLRAACQPPNFTPRKSGSGPFQPSSSSAS